MSTSITMCARAHAVLRLSRLSGIIRLSGSPLGLACPNCDMIGKLLYMRPLVRSCLLFAAMTRMLPAQDPYCPRYPSAVRTELEESLSLDREVQSYSRLAKVRPATAASRSHMADSSNFIDQLI